MKRIWRWFQWWVLGTRCECGGTFKTRYTMFGHHDICVVCGADYYETDT